MGFYRSTEEVDSASGWTMASSIWGTYGLGGSMDLGTFFYPSYLKYNIYSEFGGDDKKMKEWYSCSLINNLLANKARYNGAAYIKTTTTSPQFVNKGSEWGVSSTSRHWYQSISTATKTSTTSTQTTNVLTGFLGKPVKIINSINKSGLCFLDLNWLCGNWYAWTLLYWNNDLLLKGQTQPSSFIHHVGQGPNINVQLSICTGKNLDDSTSFTKSKITPDTISEYRQNSFKWGTSTVTKYPDININDTRIMIAGTGTSGIDGVRGSFKQYLTSINEYDEATVPEMRCNGALAYINTPGNNTTPFFVSKGDEVWLCTDFTYSFPSGGATALFFTSPWALLYGGGQSFDPTCAGMVQYKARAVVY